jgi:phospholipase C
MLETMVRTLSIGAAAVFLVAACSSSSSSGPATKVAPTASNIKHVVIIVQENHSFDSYFGAYCTAAPGSNPTCTTGASCCEAMPAKDPGPMGEAPMVLDDAENGAYDPDHLQYCEIEEIDGGKMDMYATAAGEAGGMCGTPKNFALAPASVVTPYWQLAMQGALADRYFQPVAGQSSSNDIYLARAKFEFLDDTDEPTTVGASCQLPANPAQFTDETIGDLLDQAGVPWAFYAGGYAAAVAAGAKACPASDPGCPSYPMQSYPCVYDPGDNPFQYFEPFRDNPLHDLDLTVFTTALGNGTLPGVSYVKGIGYKSEHPGYGDTISAGAAFVTSIADQVASSPYAKDTLILVTWDESGGYFDHIAPPPTSTVDNQPYGPRVPLIALGPFAQQNFIGHTVMEHSSIVKFIEWNWLGQQTGQLQTRDATVNNIGSILNPSATGVAVPDK